MTRPQRRQDNLISTPRAIVIDHIEYAKEIAALSEEIGEFKSFYEPENPDYGERKLLERFRALREEKIKRAREEADKRQRQERSRVHAAVKA